MCGGVASEQTTVLGANTQIGKYNIGLGSVVNILIGVRE